MRARKVAAQLSRLCSTTEKLDPVDSLGELRGVGEPKRALVLTVGIGPGRDPRGGSAGVDRRPQGLARPARAFPVKRQLGRGPRRAGLGELGALGQDRCEPLVELAPFAREQLLLSDLAHERVAEPDSPVIADEQHSTLNRLVERVADVRRGSVRNRHEQLLVDRPAADGDDPYDLARRPCEQREPPGH